MLDNSSLRKRSKFMNKQLVSQVNVYLANLALFYIKLHNLHWHVKGVQFKAVHEYLEELYDETTAKLDAVAELLKMEGETPLSSLNEYLTHGTVKELDSSDKCVKSALTIVLEDYQAFKKEASKIREDAIKEDEFPLVNMLEEHIEGYNKIIWFVQSMLK